MSMYVHSNINIILQTCASVATVRPKVRAICGTVGDQSTEPTQLPTPITTRRNVPIISPNRIRHIFLFSVISETPTIFDISERKSISNFVRLGWKLKPKIVKSKASYINFSTDFSASKLDVILSRSV